MPNLVSKSKGLSSRKRVFIVDDEQTFTRKLRRRLEKAGYAVDSEIDGTRALKRIAKVKPHVIVLDCILPGLLGTDVLKHLKVKSTTKAIPVIFLCEVEDDSTTVLGSKLGARRCLIKNDLTIEHIVREIAQLS